MMGGGQGGDQGRGAGILRLLGADVGQEEMQPAPARAPTATVASGDWTCAACGDHQFARNTHCRRCGNPKQSAGTPSHQQHQPQQPQQQPTTGGAFGMPPSAGGRSTAAAAQQPGGDWNCTACGDLQFARNAVCRRCGNPKPTGPATNNTAVPATNIPRNDHNQTQQAPGGKPAQDWNCAGCGDLQFARNVVCRRCGSPKPAGPATNTMTMPATSLPSQTQQAPEMTGSKPAQDWNCTGCGDLQFARNVVCRRCGNPKPTGSATNITTTPATNIPRNDHGQTQQAPGSKPAQDWNCTGCGDLQFARNVVCRKCGNPKPTNPAINASAPPVAQHSTSFEARDRVTAPEASTKPAQDWNCTACGDLQFARNVACRRCGASKPTPSTAPTHQPQQQQQLQQAPLAPVPQVQTSGTNAATATRPPIKQDWTCASCGDFQFARNDNCRKCRAPRPSAGAGASASSTPAPTPSSSAPRSDWHCDRCGDRQFARNVECRNCGAARSSGSSSAGSGLAWSCLICKNNQDAGAEKCSTCGMNRPTPEAQRIHSERQERRQERKYTSSRLYDDDYLDPVAEMNDAYDAYYYGS